VIAAESACPDNPVLISFQAVQPPEKETGWRYENANQLLSTTVCERYWLIINLHTGDHPVFALCGVLNANG
jgi:hypothetical protein